MKFILFCLIIFLFGCSNSSFKERNRNDYFQTIGGVGFILPEIPTAFNFFQPNQCQRDEGIEFLDLEKIGKEFNITSEQGLFVQFFYNQEYQSLKEKLGNKDLRLGFQEKEQSFFKALEKVRAKISPVKLPSFNQIHLAVFEDFKNKEELEKFLNSPTHNDGVPVIISFCRKQKILEEQISKFGAYAFGAEYSTVFNEELKNDFQFLFQTTKLLGENKKIKLFIPKNNKNKDYNFVKNKWEPSFF